MNGMLNKKESAFGTFEECRACLDLGIMLGDGDEHEVTQVMATPTHGSTVE